MYQKVTPLLHIQMLLLIIKIYHNKSQQNVRTFYRKTKSYSQDKSSSQNDIFIHSCDTKINYTLLVCQYAFDMKLN